MRNKRTWVISQVEKKFDLPDLQTIIAFINAYGTYREKTNPKSMLKGIFTLVST